MSGVKFRRRKRWRWYRETGRFRCLQLHGDLCYLCRILAENGKPPMPRASCNRVSLTVLPPGR